ncbi:MAG TPA: hypothetical protein VLG37_03965 [Candidatus Saccharimonadales bacterium]|nr:hypothetical protein [Candidatus Saccharimonadales bacterium]
MKMFRLLKKPFFGNELLAGIVFLVVSFVPRFLPKQDYGFWRSLLFGAAYYVGGIFIANYVVVKLSGHSMINEIFNTKERRWSFIKLGLLGAIPFSLAVSTFGGLWYFPHWSAVDYYVLGYVLLGWVFYFLFLTVCYVAFKLLFDSIIPQRNIVKGYYTFERKSYKALGIVGGWIAVMVITVGLQNSRWLTDFRVAISRPQTPYLYWYWWLIAVLGWIMLCEFVEYRRRRSSLLKDTLHGYFTPLLAVFACGITLAVTNEVQNLPINLWHYGNFPWTSFAIYQIPLFVVIAWPLHIMAFTEFWRAFGDQHATNLLFSNAIAPQNKRRQR